MRKILSGEKGPLRDVVLLNAAATLVVAGEAADLKEGLEHASRSVDSGAAMEKLEALVKITNE
jgi:anthranilate phosphoribosyltransferase